eukprot:gnl/MRDRNA2_/MRDRNA2_132808_c0_seq1.p1 gnl/MRDRNA2_/MRDRNA2_132808_c0~~gnl/MRDRNA2_/MRDRNA2_132808_c0_seq1.p1  ORF type:complete len:103 (+),score=3.16 gnl/MRDRNA2_/MRDRNA2_132808_c0_seq1:1088-1396(+)
MLSRHCLFPKKQLDIAKSSKHREFSVILLSLRNDNNFGCSGDYPWRCQKQATQKVHQYPNRCSRSISTPKVRSNAPLRIAPQRHVSAFLQTCFSILRSKPRL